MGLGQSGFCGRLRGGSPLAEAGPGSSSVSPSLGLPHAGPGPGPWRPLLLSDSQEILALLGDSPQGTLGHCCPLVARGWKCTCEAGSCSPHSSWMRLGPGSCCHRSPDHSDWPPACRHSIASGGRAPPVHLTAGWNRTLGVLGGPEGVWRLTVQRPVPLGASPGRHVGAAQLGLGCASRSAPHTQSAIPPR